jgi:hypothetical protein
MDFEERLTQLALLPRGWYDCVRGDVIDTRVIEETRNFLVRHSPADGETPMITPTEDGDIALHWYEASPISVTIYVSFTEYMLRTMEIKYVGNLKSCDATYTPFAFADVDQLVARVNDILSRRSIFG